MLKNDAKIYCITDVEELHRWHVEHLEHLEKHSLFRRVEQQEVENDICYKLMFEKTEEGIKVERNKGKKFACVFGCVKGEYDISNELNVK